MTAFLLIVAGTIAIFVLYCIRIAVADSGKTDDNQTVAVSNPYDVQRLRRELFASARNEQELEYLKELDMLDLYRRHLIC